MSTIQLQYAHITAAEFQTQFSAPVKKRVGILGGTFNPVHNGHLIIAEQVRDKLKLDKVYLMPNAEPPHIDPKEASPKKQRLEMLALAIEDNQDFDIETIELESEGKSYTYDTMDILTTLHPDTLFYFIIGADMVEYLPKWYRIDELVEMIQFVGVKRPGYSLVTEYPIIAIDVPDIAISSTGIRNAVKLGESIKYLVPAKVQRYIEKEGLYLD